MTELARPQGREGAPVDAGLLVAAARPDLYRINAFRIAELPVDATARDLARRQQVVEMATSTGVPVPPGPGRALPLPAGTDPAALRDALQRLRDPEHRLVDEFFWFWPQQLGQSSRDEALLALARGDSAVASELWVAQEQSSAANVSMHNLAVLSHAVALDLEARGPAGASTPEERAALEAYWQSALQRWRLLLDYPPFWERLAARIHELNDPRLTVGLAARLRDTMPRALLTINARLAVEAAERGDHAEARRHVELINGTRFPAEARDASLHDAAEPLRERLRTLGRSAEADANREGERADEIAYRLLDQAAPLLAALDALLLADDPIRVAVHDELARRVLACDIVYTNVTKQWRRSAALLERVLPLAASAATREELENNLAIDRRNQEAEAEAAELSTCRFCGQREPAPNAAVGVVLKQNLSTEAVPIPRCRPCAQAHHREKAWPYVVGWIFALPFLLLEIPACISARYDRRNQGAAVLGMFVLLVLAGVAWAVGALVGWGITQWLLAQGHGKSVRTAAEHPRVQELRAQGWKPIWWWDWRGL